MKFDNWGFFKNLPRNSKFYESLRRIFGILHVGLSMFMKGSDWILLRVRNASEKSCRENHKTHFMFNYFSFKNRAVYEIRWKSVTDPNRPRLTISYGTRSLHAG
jgi:hypothetical protein